MRGDDEKLQAGMFSYITLEDRIPKNHPLRGIRQLVDGVLKGLSPEFERLYAKVGRPSIPPERLLRALLLQAFYSIRSERLLMEQLKYNLLFPWFVGLEIDDAVWNHAVFSKNRERLLSEFPDSGGRITWGGDKAYDTVEHVALVRELGATPHVAQNNTNRQSAIDGRTTRHPGYEISLSRRWLVEKVFGWLKQTAGMRQVKLRGLEKVQWLFIFSCAAYNLLRIPKLREQSA